MKYKIFLIYHSHIDIGYTERQEKIAVYQGDFIKQAVEHALSPKQRERGADAKFKFTAEGFWAVEQYLARYGAEGEERLLQAIRSGCFELTAGYVHMAELLNYENLRRSLDYCAAFCRRCGIPAPEVAMAADINGFSWGYADALIERGVKYLATNINTHHGGAPFSKPLVPFWWQAPSGKKLLVWNGLTYHKANLLGLIPGLTPVGDPGIPGMLVEETGFLDVRNTDYAHKRIGALIEALRAEGYPYHFLPIMGSGLYTDNSPAGEDHCELLEEWNKKYGDEVTIVTGTLQEFFEYLQEQVPDIPTYAGDWNDWWTDGVISTPTETRIFRNAQRTERLIEMLDPDCRVVSKEERGGIVKNLILYAEHTWGHSASYTDPCKLLVRQLDARKAKLATDADVQAGVCYDRLARALGEGEFAQRRPFTYVIVNPLDTPAEKEVLLPTDFWEEGLFTDGKYAVYDGEKKIPSQRTYTLRGAFVACVVALGAKERRTLTIRFGEEPPAVPDTGFSRFGAAYDAEGLSSITYGGEEIYSRRGGAFCTPVYQIFRGGKRSDAAGFGYSARKKPQGEIVEGKLLRCTVAEDGCVFTKLVYEFAVEGAKRAQVGVYLYKGLPRIDVEADFAKDLVLDPEGLYVRFPFRLRGGEWMLDKAGAFFKPGCQLPDTCCDYYPVVRGAALVGADNSISVNCLDTPLVTFGRIKLWDYTLRAEAEGDLYSWITNNKWETNFRAACAGFLESRYRIGFGGDPLSRLEENEYDFLVLRK